MPGKRKTVATVTAQTVNPDGSVTIRRVGIANNREIGAAAAGRTLGLHVKTVHRLCELGEARGGLKVWKLPSARGNAKWRINLQSVANFRTRHQGRGTAGKSRPSPSFP